jgi:hypothetical protein
MTELTYVYNSAYDPNDPRGDPHLRQGTNARLMCSITGACPDFRKPMRNGEAVAANAGRSMPIRIRTIGANPIGNDLDAVGGDAVYVPSVCCLTPPYGSGIDNRSSQIVEGADVIFVPMVGTWIHPTAPLGKILPRTITLEALLDAPAAVNALLNAEQIAEVVAASYCASNSHAQVMINMSGTVAARIGPQYGSP